MVTTLTRGVVGFLVCAVSDAKGVVGLTVVVLIEAGVEAVGGGNRGTNGPVGY